MGAAAAVSVGMNAVSREGTEAGSPVVFFVGTDAAETDASLFVGSVGCV